MHLARDLINLPIVTISGGQEIGKVRDLYLDEALKQVTALYLGTDGLLNRSTSFIRQADVVTFGQDAILVQDADCILDEATTPELSEWLKAWVRREDLQGREMSTPGGTKIGRVGDIILDEAARITGLSLSQVFVSGPVADNRAVIRSAIVEPEDGKYGDVLTVRLAEAERANLRIEHETFFSAATVKPAEESEVAIADA